MEDLQDVISMESKDLLGTLEPFQVKIVNQFLEQTDSNSLMAADRWLNASLANTAKFGGEPKGSNLYRDKILDELEKFLCGDDRYAEDREKLKVNSDHSAKYIIGVLSAAIGKTLGVAGPFIAPVIVLLIISINKMLINAWCELRKEHKKNIV